MRHPALGTLAFVLVVPMTVIGYVPYTLTHWVAGAPLFRARDSSASHSSSQPCGGVRDRPREERSCKAGRRPSPASSRPRACSASARRRVTSPRFVNKTVAELEAMPRADAQCAPSTGRVMVRYVAALTVSKSLAS